MTREDEEKTVCCSFCGKHQDQVRRIIAGPNVFICNECVELCMGILEANQDLGPIDLEERTNSLPTPREIHAVLDQYVIGRRRPRWPCPLRCITTISASAFGGNEDVELQKSNIR